MKRAIERLTAEHDCSTFACGKDSLDKYIRQNALINQDMGYGRTYVAVRDDETRRVDGYYTVSMSSVQFEHLPDGLRFSRMPKYPMPAAHMGCLAVQVDCQRQGLGSLLLIDAMQRMIAASEVVAARAIEVKAIDEGVRDWYATYGFAAFTSIGGPPFHLYLPMDTAREIVITIGDGD